MVLNFWKVEKPVLNTVKVNHSNTGWEELIQEGWWTLFHQRFFNSRYGSMGESTTTCCRSEPHVLHTGIYTVVLYDCGPLKNLFNELVLKGITAHFITIHRKKDSLVVVSRKYSKWRAIQQALTQPMR